MRSRSETSCGQPAHLVVEALPVVQVARERVLGRDGDGLELEIEVAWVDAPRAVAQERAERAGKERAELDVGESRERADRVDAGSA